MILFVKMLTGEINKARKQAINIFTLDTMHIGIKVAWNHLFLLCIFTDDKLKCST